MSLRLLKKTNVIVQRGNTSSFVQFYILDNSNGSRKRSSIRTSLLVWFYYRKKLEYHAENASKCIVAPSLETLKSFLYQFQL